MTGSDIAKTALKYTDGSFVYWYGGKGEKCTEILLASLASRYPRVYTASYEKKCRADIAAGKRCIDCSGLVCKAYGIADEGTYQIAQDGRFLEYQGIPKDGMILWKWTHCGIYYQGKVIEARGKDAGVTKDREFKHSEWSRIYFMEGVTYSVKRTAIEHLQAAIDVIKGKYGTGDQRKSALTSGGYDYQKVQNLVNTALK